MRGFFLALPWPHWPGIVVRVFLSESFLLDWLLLQQQAQFACLLHTSYIAAYAFQVIDQSVHSSTSSASAVFIQSGGSIPTFT